MKHRQSGLSYIEVLIATLLIVIALVPMMDALQPGLQGSQIHRDRAEINFALAGKLETLLSESFADLDAAASEESEGYRAVLDRQLRSWRARTEHLRLQSALGSMGIRDDLEELGTRLNRARSGALVELQVEFSELEAEYAAGRATLHDLSELRGRMTAAEACFDESVAKSSGPSRVATMSEVSWGDVKARFK